MTTLTVDSPQKYQTLTTDNIIAYLCDIKSICRYFGEAANKWHAAEMGDGNLNLVFTVSCGKKKLIVKQALPYLRLVGKDWPLPLKRSYFEANALAIEAEHAPDRVPKIYHVDNDMALIVMEFCEPHIILRKGFM